MYVQNVHIEKRTAIVERRNEYKKSIDIFTQL